MQLYKRGRVWWIRWGHNGIKFRETTRCTDKRAAELFLKRRERQQADPAHYAATTATIESAARRFLDELKHEDVAEGTRQMYDVKVRHVVRLLGAVRLAELEHATILGYAKTREAEGNARHTIHKELTALRRVLHSAYRAGELSRDPRAFMPKYSTGYTPTEQWIDEADLWRVIRELEPGRGAFVAFAVATGADTGDVERAQVADLGKTSIRVRGSKTAKRDRTIPHMSLFEDFIDYVRAHADGKKPKLFRPWENIRRDLAAAIARASTCPKHRRLGNSRPVEACSRCERLAIPTFSPKKLRHTTMTWLVRAGVPFELVAKIAGLASTAMLYRVYGHLLTEDVGALIEERLRRARRGAQKEHTRKPRGRERRKSL